MNSIEKEMRQLLTEAGFLKKGGDPIDALQDALFELKEVGKDHHRMECLAQIMQENDMVVIINRNHPTKLRNKIQISVNGKDVRGKYLNDALDKLHEKLHKSKRKSR